MKQTIVDIMSQHSSSESSINKNCLATDIVGLIENAYTELTEKEKHLAFNILRSILTEIEKDILAKLSETAAKKHDFDIDIITYLANEEIDIARPILEFSEVLNDPELKHIIELRTFEHHMSITLRQFISEDISDAIVEHSNETTIVSLLQNENAEISNLTLQYLVNESERYDSFQNPLLHRKDLSKGLAKKMFGWVSESLKDMIVEKYQLDDEEVFGLLKNATKECLNTTPAPQPAKDLASTLNIEHSITPNMLNAALIDGEIALFFSLVSEMSGLDETEVKEIVFETNGKRMIILCKALDIPEFQFGLIYKTSRYAHPQLRKDMDADLKKSLNHYRKVEPAKAIELVKAWRVNS